MTPVAATPAAPARTYAEHWQVGTIATRLDTHPGVARCVLGLSVARPPSQLRKLTR